MLNQPRVVGNSCSLSLRVFLSLYRCLSPSIAVYRCLSLYLPVSMSIAVFFCLSQPLSLSPRLFVSVSFCLSIPFTVSVSPCLSLRVFGFELVNLVCTRQVLYRFSCLVDPLSPLLPSSSSSTLFAATGQHLKRQNKRKKKTRI